MSTKVQLFRKITTLQMKKSNECKKVSQTENCLTIVFEGHNEYV